jgi:electron transfer flavoprotein beta subunit
VKILVAIKRVLDPDNANKIKVADSGSAIDGKGLEWKINPFDEYALEAALRLIEDGKSKARHGEVVVVTLGPKECEATLRSALATGADRAIRVDAKDDALDGRLVAKALSALVQSEKPDLVLMGKQAVDGDSNFVGQALAQLLDYPMATFAATIREEGDGAVVVNREVDGGTTTLRLRLPALVTVDLRIVAPDSVYSKHTDTAFRYNDGVRFAPLPAIMKAKKKPLDTKTLAELVSDSALGSSYFRFEPPPQRQAGIKVASVTELVDKLTNEARVV